MDPDALEEDLANCMFQDGYEHPTPGRCPIHQNRYLDFVWVEESKNNNTDYEDFSFADVEPCAQPIFPILIVLGFTARSVLLGSLF